MQKEQKTSRELADMIQAEINVGATFIKVHRRGRSTKPMLKNADDYERLAKRAEERAAGRWPQSK